ncbi:hypothetical protein KDL44_08420 [bacterium]|nr:hypothetical protein [bacterium]
MDIEALFGILAGTLMVLSIPGTMIYLRQLARTERRESREMYERIVRDRLFVIQTALEAGFDDREVARLDRRLSGLIGQQEMQKLAGVQIRKVPEAPEDRELDILEDEVEEIIERRKRKQERELKRQIRDAGM